MMRDVRTMSETELHDELRTVAQQAETAESFEARIRPGIWVPPLSSEWCIEQLRARDASIKSAARAEALREARAICENVEDEQTKRMRDYGHSGDERCETMYYHGVQVASEVHRRILSLLEKGGER